MKKKSQKQKKKNSFSKKERYIISLSLFLILIFIFLTYFIIFFDKQKIIDNNYSQVDLIIEEEGIYTKDEIEDNLVPRFIDGTLTKAHLANLYPVALVLDNDPKNRYPIGIENASLVYELPTEGASSRFLAIFSSDINIERVGPIRSARPYFVDLAEDSSALLVHCGGSPQSLAQLSQGRIISLNEFYYGHYFWRDLNYLAPNNIFINSISWQKFLENQGLKQVNRSTWKFIQEGELEKDLEICHDNILVNYSKNYQRTWQYNKESNVYQIKGDNSNIQAKNLIFHYATSQVLDDLLRLQINLLGEGKTVICQLGSCKEGTWQKKTKTERLRYYDNNDIELNFIAGNTWVSVISAGAYINY